jgi:hypothetical protein
MQQPIQSTNQSREKMQADTGPIFGLEKGSLFNQQHEDICND